LKPVSMFSCLCDPDTGRVQDALDSKEAELRLKRARAAQLGKSVKWDEDPTDAISVTEFESKYLNMLQTGDLILFSSPNCYQLQRLSKSRWNHVGIVYRRDGKNLVKRDVEESATAENPSELLLLEAVEGPSPTDFEGERRAGVDLGDLQKRIHAFFNAPTVNGEERYIGIRRYEIQDEKDKEAELTPAQLKALDETFDRYKDCAFETDKSALVAAVVDTNSNKYKSKEDDSKLFSSELVAYALMNMGIMKTENDGGEIASEYSPADFGCDADGKDLPLTRGTYDIEIFVRGPKTKKLSAEDCERVKARDVSASAANEGLESIAGSVPHWDLVLDGFWTYVQFKAPLNILKLWVMAVATVFVTGISFGFLLVNAVTGFANMIHEFGEKEEISIGSWIAAFNLGEHLNFQTIITSFLICLCLCLTTFACYACFLVPFGIGFILAACLYVTVLLHLMYVPMLTVFKKQSIVETFTKAREYTSGTLLSFGRNAFFFVVTVFCLALLALPMHFGALIFFPMLLVNVSSAYRQIATSRNEGDRFLIRQLGALGDAVKDIEAGKAPKHKEIS